MFSIWSKYCPNTDVFSIKEQLGKMLYISLLSSLSCLFLVLLSYLKVPVSVMPSSRNLMKRTLLMPERSEQDNNTKNRPVREERREI